MDVDGERVRIRNPESGGLPETVEMMLLASVLVLNGLFCASHKESTMLREPAVAGQFYPADAKVLTEMVDRMLNDAQPPELIGRVVAIQVPHAGYPFSGPTAAYAFKMLQGMDSVTVVIIGPSHRVYIDKAAVFCHGKWRTPLGDVDVDEELAKAIVAGDDFLVDMPQVHKLEHSIEVEVPFLQRAFSGFKIVPIMLLQGSWEQCERVGKAIAHACQDRNVVLVASSDLYHGYSYDEDKQADSVTTELMAGFDPKAFYEALRQGKAQACGGYPIVATMVAARELGADKAVVLHKTNSNDVTGEKGGYCVGYSAVVFLDSSKTDKKSNDLTEQEKRNLLGIARNTLEDYIRNNKILEVKPLTPRLSEKRGVFVTLHKQGQLRGCIGYIEPVKPLYLAVNEMAVAASTEDPRFPRVTMDELSDIDIEITVLSRLQRITDPNSVVVGKHGLVIRKGYQSGLLLPQVPVEQGWDRKQFLEYTCLKAGLPTDAWQDKDSELYVFTGQVFGEKER
ncbi:hypothetical protein CH330_08300 [candidate division WOR-3 bacterium JGI_Cruoil_03_51_56]|uniref:MEMO1 family protein CH330_08300 n=1 Tax=candidate division WOR-3 bacterium JGI_Cruoil_03_51_56 TaxID=1973747 RepID=A0A235BQD1_UNCW3|nr:MAG: hypothetical protein CH330_08300 [candidate division WOR-3 bacterium JGI_Cruoil_03_51_56]